MSVYNGDNPTYLELALRSIYDMQTFKPHEIVVVFDGPLNDELYTVLNDFALDKKDIVRYCPLDENKGLGEALRIGCGLCTGDYIFRMDSDDICDSRRFEKQAKFVESHPDIDVLGTDIAEFEQSIDENMRVRSCPAKHDDIVKMSKKRNPMNHVSVCIKRIAIEKCGGYETLLLLEDYYLWLKMIVSDCKLANINESLVYVRVGNGFNNKRSSKIRIVGWDFLQKFMLEHKMITPFNALVNKILVRVFVNTPPKLKSFLYKSLLRK